MVNFHDPAAIVQESLSFLKLWHGVTGIYLWEFITNLDYEWGVICGNRPYRWTIWIYSLTRVACFMGVVLSFVTMDVGSPINCQIWVTLVVIFFDLGSAAGSLLIVLRIIAIWNKNRIVVATAIGVWGINVVIAIQTAARLRFVWIPGLLYCSPINIGVSLPNVISMVVTDITLLLIMLVGLLRLHPYRDGGRKFGLSHVLWTQGVIWLVIATAAEIPPAVFIVLNFNDAFNTGFQIPALVTMAIAATRMHRSLVDFASGCSDIELDDIQIRATIRDHPGSLHTDSTQLEGVSHLRGRSELRRTIMTCASAQTSRFKMV